MPIVVVSPGANMSLAQRQAQAGCVRGPDTGSFHHSRALLTACLQPRFSSLKSVDLARPIDLRDNVPHLFALLSFLQSVRSGSVGGHIQPLRLDLSDWLEYLRGLIWAIEYKLQDGDSKWILRRRPFSLLYSAMSPISLASLSK
jgi:hypothetical protein